MTQSGEAAPINTFPHFFETLYRSGLYWEFLGWGQLLAALLLMTQRFATLGALMFLPIIVNIFVITLSYEFAGTPIVTGLMLAGNIFLLTWDYPKLRILFVPESATEVLISNQNHGFSGHGVWVYLGVLIFVTTVIYVLLNGRNPTGWFFICLTEGLIGLFLQNGRYKQTLRHPAQMVKTEF